MDLEEVQDNILTQLTEYQNQIMNSLSSLKTSTTSQTDSLIFSELRTLLKEQNEQGRQNLSDNAEKLRSNAAEISGSLKRSVEQTETRLQNQLNGIADSVCNQVSKNIKNLEQNCISATTDFYSSVKSGKAEISKAVNEQRKAIFKTWSNVLLFLLAGSLFSFLGIFGYSFFKIQDGFYRELAENQKIESIRKEAVNEYKKELMNPDAKEISKMVEQWKKKNK